MALKQIRLELARSREFPEGSDKHGYEFFAPLKPDGHIDGAHFKELAQLCTVHKFWDGEDEHGQIVRTGDDKHFAFSYQPGEEDDEPFFKLARHASGVRPMPRSVSTYFCLFSSMYDER